MLPGQMPSCGFLSGALAHCWVPVRVHGVSLLQGGPHVPAPSWGAVSRERPLLPSATLRRLNSLPRTWVLLCEVQLCPGPQGHRPKQGRRSHRPDSPRGRPSRTCLLRPGLNCIFPGVHPVNSHEVGTQFTSEKNASLPEGTHHALLLLSPRSTWQHVLCD